MAATQFQLDDARDLLGPCVDRFGLYAQPKVGTVARDLHKARRRDRIAHLRSLNHDAAYVGVAHSVLGRPPVLANLRCGVWYVPPAIRHSACYFKSTDGHSGCWDFSITRLNLQVALAAAEHGRAMVVDATRSGKRFPDALTKTVPIWCCVVNRALAAERAERAAAADELSPAAWDARLHLPPWVPPSERSQIEARLDGWVAALRKPALAPVVSRLDAALDRPLVPSWLCPDAAETASERAGRAGPAAERGYREASQHAASAAAAAAEAAEAGAPFYAIHCVSASEASTSEHSRERASWTYVQGAGDDEENWSRGLTPAQWWTWRGELMRLAELGAELADEELSRLEAQAVASPEPAAAGGGAAAAGEVVAGPSADADAGASGGGGVPCAPVALWGSRLLLGRRCDADTAAVWEHADAVLDVGGSVLAPCRPHKAAEAGADADAEEGALQPPPPPPPPPPLAAATPPALEEVHREHTSHSISATFTYDGGRFFHRSTSTCPSRRGSARSPARTTGNASSSRRRCASCGATCWRRGACSSSAIAATTAGPQWPPPPSSRSSARTPRRCASPARRAASRGWGSARRTCARGSRCCRAATRPRASRARTPRSSTTSSSAPRAGGAGSASQLESRTVEFLPLDPTPALAESSGAAGARRPARRGSPARATLYAVLIELYSWNS